MTLEIGGEITSIDQFEAIVEAIEAECGSWNDYFQNVEDRSVRAALIYCADNEMVPVFAFDEVNYADLDAFRDVGVNGLDAIAYNEAGGGYGAGYRSFNAATNERFDWCVEDEDRIPAQDITKVLDDASILPPDKLTAIQALVDAQRRSQWTSLRPFSIAPCLLAQLKAPEPEPDTVPTKVGSAVDAALAALGISAESTPTFAEDLTEWLAERAPLVTDCAEQEG
ncbi:hypothetical protein [Oceaniradius stylonematis]|uniref:hypothetical protein n=1 Tax=Oceaniradius stylonematis TaxID=2184161 RepID=UPI00273D0E4D|nr:hypothetical protein [Oceaniradius stylonematis]